MKKTTHLIVVLIAAVFAFSSCKKDDSTSPSSSNNASMSSIATTGTWHVSYYHESGDDHTSNFTGYTFTFNSNGTMTATNSSGTTSGTWSTDDSSNEFHISLGSASPLSDLTHGWLIISKTSTQINLKDDNTTHSEEVHFTKN